MLAAHVRRGDYAGSCAHFARWSSSFYGWNQLPFLPDRFEIPGGASWGENTPENTALYMRRCWPTTEQIVRRMHEARAAYVDAGYGDGRVLDIAFVLSDGDRSFIGELREALMADGWGTVVTSRDLQLDSEQYGVAMAVDMEVAAKAAVFVGNGWSSFTSNIMHRRLVSGKEGLANRHW